MTLAGLDREVSWVGVALRLQELHAE